MTGSSLYFLPHCSTLFNCLKLSFGSYWKIIVLLYVTVIHVLYRQRKFGEGSTVLLGIVVVVPCIA